MFNILRGSNYFSKAAEPYYIPIDMVWEFNLSIVSNTCYYLLYLEFSKGKELTECVCNCEGICRLAYMIRGWWNLKILFILVSWVHRYGLPQTWKVDYIFLLKSLSSIVKISVFFYQIVLNIIIYHVNSMVQNNNSRHYWDLSGCQALSSITLYL